MRLPETMEAEFVERHNRFLASVMVDGKIINTHVKNTSRLTEIFVPGTKVLLAETHVSGRKTTHDLIAAYKGDMLISLDSQVPNEVFAEALPNLNLFQNIKEIRREVTKRDSRYDFAVDADGKMNYIEVKGVTLEENGIAMFPGAPTARGTKHVRGLIEAAKEGFGAYIVFVVQMSPVERFTPNYSMDREFCDALINASENGVQIIAYKCDVSKKHIAIESEIPVIF